MAEENGGNGGNGKRTGLIERVREDAEDIKKLVKEKGKEEIDSLKDPEKTQLYRSIFRVKHDETPRSPFAGRAEQRFFAPASGQGQSRRGEIQLHLGNGRHHVLSVYRPHVHRRAA